jgi:hypothetical protein
MVNNPVAEAVLQHLGEVAGGLAESEDLNCETSDSMALLSLVQTNIAIVHLLDELVTVAKGENNEQRRSTYKNY